MAQAIPLCRLADYKFSLNRLPAVLLSGCRWKQIGFLQWL
jgi:CspA family cold shock protein